MKSLWAVVIAVIVYILIGCAMAFGSQENPTKEELFQTVDHIQRLAKEQQGTIRLQKSELDDLKVTQIPKLQLEINKQAGELQKCEVDNQKKNTAIWRNLILGLVAGAALGFLGPKLLSGGLF